MRQRTRALLQYLHLSQEYTEGKLTGALAFFAGKLRPNLDTVVSDSAMGDCASRVAGVMLRHLEEISRGLFASECLSCSLARTGRV